MNYHEESGKFLPGRPGKQTLTEQEIKNYSAQLVSAIAYIHSRKIVHCDLKP